MQTPNTAECAAVTIFRLSHKNVGIVAVEERPLGVNSMLDWSRFQPNMEKTVGNKN